MGGSSATCALFSRRKAGALRTWLKNRVWAPLSAATVSSLQKLVRRFLSKDIKMEERVTGKERDTRLRMLRKMKDEMGEVARRES